MHDRIPPQSLTAEMAVLGAVMIDREALEAAVDLVVPSDFYAHVHESIWAVVLELYAAEKPVDKLAVAERLRDRQLLERVGGVPYLNSLIDTPATASSAEYYASIVVEKAKLRALIRAGGEIAECGYGGEVDVDRAIAKAESAFTIAVDRNAARAGGSELGAALDANYAALCEASSGTIDSDAILTPWKRLNDVIGPLLPGEMCLVVAAAKMGKTALLLMLADWIAATYGLVALVSLEMSKRAVSMRYTAMTSGVSARRQRMGYLDPRELERIFEATQKLHGRPVNVFDSASISRLSDLRRELRMLSKRARIRAICIDGLNFLADVDAQKGERSSKNDRLDFLYREILRFGKEFGAVVFAAQHVNREGMSGPPSLKDIRDGGNPEGHAHAIIAPYRPKPNGDADERRQGEFIVLAARDGASGTVSDMQFEGHRSLWLDRNQLPWFEPQRAPEEDANQEFDLAFGVPA